MFGLEVVGLGDDVWSLENDRNAGIDSTEFRRSCESEVTVFFAGAGSCLMVSVFCSLAVR